MQKIPPYHLSLDESVREVLKGFGAMANHLVRLVLEVVVVSDGVVDNQVDVVLRKS